MTKADARAAEDRSRAQRRASGYEQRAVTKGPFPETGQLIAGFWMFQVKSREEAFEWVKRCPNPMESDAEIEIRQVFEAADFGDALSPELKAAEERISAQMAANAKR